MRVYDGETYSASRSSNSLAFGPGRSVRRWGTARSSNRNMEGPLTLLGRLTLPRLIDVVPPRTPPDRQIGQFRDRRVQPEDAIEAQDDPVVRAGAVPTVEELPGPVVRVARHEQD